MKKLVFSTILVLQAFIGFAQMPTGVAGKVFDTKTQKPLQSVVVSITNTNLTQLTAANGNFSISGVAKGTQLLQIKSDGYKDQLLQIEIESGKMLDLGTVYLEHDVTNDEGNLVAISDNDLSDDNNGSESTASLLQASRDAFQQAAAFNWGQARFRTRGLDSEYATLMINGVVMNKIYDGRPQYGNWGGLNDATRNQEFTFGSVTSDYTFGGILGTNEINTRASLYRSGNRVTIGGANTNYTGRLMGTMSSGMMSNGWAYTLSASRRFANEGYFEGTTFNANSFFASIEKKISKNNSLNFTTIFGQNRRGKNSPNTQEVFNSQGERYNSYWGYQNGEKRNSRIKTIEEPILMLTDYWKINSKTNITTSLSYQFGKIGNSRIDFQGVPNPDPAYYKNMPSYFTSLFDSDPSNVLLNDPNALLPGGLGGINLYSGYATHNNSSIASNLPYINAYNGVKSAAFVTNQQLDWSNLYITNAIANNNFETTKYVFYEDRTDDKQLSGNMNLNSQLADNISFNGGVILRKLESHNFKNLLDLLGGNYYLDINLFGKDDQKQSDLNNPNRKVVKGDVYGYNYNLVATNYDIFTQFKFIYKKVDFYLGQTYSHNEYQREGLYKNGYYPTNSFGKSNLIQYDNFGFKGGFTYKITGRQFFTFNGTYMTKAPTMRNIFNNARVNNSVTIGVDSETISSADASFIINNPKLKTRLTAYYSKIENQTETSFFFGDGAGIDDPTTSINESNTFVAETITGLNKKNIGLEFGIEYPITSSLKIMASGAYGEYIFDNNPNVKISVDATGVMNDYGKAHLKNYKQAGTPQIAGSIGLEYRDPKFWNIGANINFLGNNYIDIAPITRTDRFYADPASLNGSNFTEATQARGDELLRQEKFNDFSLLNLNGGKSWKIKNQILGLNANISNVLNVLYKTGGFEQARNSNYRQLNQDISSGTPAFGPKYFYGYGRTFSINLYLNF
jgi:CarboxypepD_reg-like domain